MREDFFYHENLLWIFVGKSLKDSLLIKDFSISENFITFILALIPMTVKFARNILGSSKYV